MARINVTDARNDFAATIDRAANGERIILVHHDKPKAALIPMQDYELLSLVYERALANMGPAVSDEAKESHKQRVRESAARMTEVHAEVLRKLAE